MLFRRLVETFTKHGVQVLSSVAPLLWINQATDKSRLLVELPNDRLFSYILRDGKLCAGGGGLHMTEIYLLEALAEVLSPKSIFIIGNAYGWSALALALAFPGAKVVAIDSGAIGGGDDGIEWTNSLAKAEGLNIVAVRATSPQDVERVAVAHLNGRIDLVLIDGAHNNEQQTLDFEACRRAALPECVYLLHDVLNWNMVPSFQEIVKVHEADLYGEILTRTASGMAIFYPKTMAETIDPVIRVFIDQFAFAKFTD